MPLGDYFKGPEHKANAARLEAELEAHRHQTQVAIQALQAKYDDLETKARELGLLDLLAVQKQILAEEARLASVQAEVATTQGDLEAARGRLQEIQQQILGAEDTVQLESFALYEPKYQFTNSIDYKNRLDEIREEQKRTARGLSAEVDAWDNYAVEFTKAQWKKLRKDALKLALRSFNSESEYCVDNVKFSNLEKMEERIRRSFETCNRLLKAVDAWWRDIVLERKLQELYLAHEYQMKRQEEKEAARQAREDQREQEKLEKEIREARAKIEKERRHFTSALQKLQLRLGAAVDQQERDDLQTRIDEISSQNNKLDEEERLLDYREQNARAGYVYVISNIGAFGEGIFKLGMTRRLEPMDRVDELGDASVPFRFDVHALVFSDNAPALEAKLHSHFAAGRTFYAELSDTYQNADCGDFSRRVVLPLLDGGDARMALPTLSLRLGNWIEGFEQPITLATDSLAWDWPWIQKLFEEPGTWPANLDGQPLLLTMNYLVDYDQFEAAIESAFSGGLRRHHALDDAKANRLGWIAAGGDTEHHRPRYRLADILAQMPPGSVALDEEMRAWESEPPIGKEIL